MSYEAGYWEQHAGVVVLSRHRTLDRAIEAARKYARLCSRHSCTGGRWSWAGFYRSSGAGWTAVHHRDRGLYEHEAYGGALAAS